MEVFTKGAELADWLSLREGTTGFVPTMGALHEGHCSLVDRARVECNTVVVSIFVNPNQFNDPKDLENYPRTPGEDLAALERNGVEAVYMPSVEDIYPEPDTRQFDFGTLGKVMEGAHRPGHFNGVAQVVSRLFEIVKPDKAYFGEKDFQQLAIIREMVRKLGQKVEITGCPIVREPDGLALSSRNALLTPEHRKAAPAIYRALCEGSEAVAAGLTVEEVKRTVTDKINSSGLLRVEYFTLVDASTLADVDDWSEADNIRGCVAVFAGDVRLIDNIDILLPCR